MRLLLSFVITLLLTLPLSAQDIPDSTNSRPVDSGIRKVSDTALPKKLSDSTLPSKPAFTISPARRDSLKRVAAENKLKDSLALVKMADSTTMKPIDHSHDWPVIQGIPLVMQILQKHPYFNFSEKPLVIYSDLKIFRGKETLFYVMIGLVLVFALLKLAFPKYFDDLFRVFFRTTMKQRQIREQLIQTPLPSLLYNLFFLATAGLYLDFILQYFDFHPVDNFWLLYLYCAIGLGAIYLVKFIGLKICGWLFSMTNAADSYIFIVFIINKAMGIFLLPFLVFLAFTDPKDPVFSIALVISWCGIGALYFYRFILGYSAVRNEVRFNLFYFFLYLAAFEVAPLLLIYRVLLYFFK